MKCGHEWESRVDNPKYCPKCGNRNWKTPKKSKKEENKEEETKNTDTIDDKKDENLTQ